MGWYGLYCSGWAEIRDWWEVAMSTIMKLCCSQSVEKLLSSYATGDFTRTAQFHAAGSVQTFTPYFLNIHFTCIITPATFPSM
jgi:hypothetical protein